MGTAQTSIDPEYCDITQAARIARVSESTIRRWIAEKLITASKIRNTVRIPNRAFLELLDGSTNTAVRNTRGAQQRG
jgi:excisionase family DNA binding protein